MVSVEKVDTNLQGQKLGRKGRITRERILTAARELIEDPTSDGFSLSAVARRAGLRMSSIYNYFSDLPELFLAVLEPVSESAEEAFLSQLRQKWPDDELHQRARKFVLAFCGYWEENSRILHLRNVIADQHETRVVLQRIAMARKVIALLGQQMGVSKDMTVSPSHDLASVLYTGLERVVTIATDEQLKAHYPAHIKPRYDGQTLEQQARVLSLAIADERARLACKTAA